MHSRSLFPALFAATVLAGAARADTILLKDGTSLQGRVLRTEGDDYVLEVQVTKSIRDERKVPRSSVAKITGETSDEKPYQELLRLFPVPELSTTEDYDALLHNHFEPFLKSHGTSRHYREVREMRDKIAAERAVVAAGGIKFNGRLIQAAERQADAIDIDSAAAHHAMKTAAEAGDFLRALREFSGIERDFPGTTAHAEATTLAKKVLTAFRTRLNADIAAQPERLRQREVGLERMDPAQRARVKETLEKRDKAFDAQLAKERQDGVKWLPIDPYRKESLEETLRLVESERTRLQTPAADTPSDSPAAAYRDAWQKLGSANAEEAKTILENFKRFPVAPRYHAMLEQRAASAPAKP